MIGETDLNDLYRKPGTEENQSMNSKLLRTLAFIVLIGIIFVASCATFAQGG